MRKALLPILLVFVGLGLVVTVFQGPLAMRVMKGGLERNVTVDPFASRADGLHVVLCGAGGPLPDPTRGGPCVAVIAGEHLFLVDVGSGASRRLARLGSAIMRHRLSTNGARRPSRQSTMKFVCACVLERIHRFRTTNKRQRMNHVPRGAPSEL